ncbi:phosphoribosyltransferase [Aureimonas sp. AU4]|uniref:phosphoribosyltransferase n=1 Tax=Aureimonas sp. AU4 TaxID=1638163 RepID=UPI0009EC894A|nr:phosphoribosyltransferase [Aureimonas sp. AU4]
MESLIPCSQSTAGEQALSAPLSSRDAPEPHQFWQDLLPPDVDGDAPAGGYRGAYPACLPDGRRLLLPIRALPGDGAQAVASLIVNQASFRVEDALVEAMAQLAAPVSPEVVVGVPTLGLPLANGVARRLGHARMVALGTSRKFWYDEALSQPMRSITSPAAGKTLFLDPRMLPLLKNRRVLLVDDVLSTGASICAALRLLGAAGCRPVAIAAAMLQGERWREPVEALAPGLPVIAALRSPRLARRTDGGYDPAA